MEPDITAQPQTSPPKPEVKKKKSGGFATLMDSARVAFDMLRMHKMRSFLTMLGVIIGVMSVSLIVLVQNGFQAYIASEFESLSPDTMWIIYDPSQLEEGQNRGRFEAMGTTERDYLLANSKTLRTVTGVVMAQSQTVRAGEEEAENTNVTGIDPLFYEAQNRDLVAGRLITQADVDNLENVAVISTDLAKELFDTENALGKRVEMNGISLSVIGLVKVEQQNLGPGSTNTLEMPVTTAQRKWIGGRNFAYLMARPKEGVSVQKATQDTWENLMRLSGNKKVYRIQSSEALLGTLNGVIGAAGMVLASVAALSLLVGGIGIMNIMLVSVTERTREIGLRKSVGARRGVILSQFLVEAAFLSLVGGLIGMGLAYGFGLLVQMLTKARGFPNEDGLVASFPLLQAIMAAGFSAGIGMVFGFFPAMNASQLDPIVALRKD